MKKFIKSIKSFMVWFMVWSTAMVGSVIFLITVLEVSFLMIGLLTMG